MKYLAFVPALAFLLVSMQVLRAADATIKLVDVAADAGLRLFNVSGGLAKDYIVDMSGNGAAFFDYDNDNDLDVIIVNGSTHERPERRLAGGWISRSKEHVRVVLVYACEPKSFDSKRLEIV